MASGMARGSLRCLTERFMKAALRMAVFMDMARLAGQTATAMKGILSMASVPERVFIFLRTAIDMKATLLMAI